MQGDQMNTFTPQDWLLFNSIPLPYLWHVLAGAAPAPSVCSLFRVNLCNALPPVLHRVSFLPQGRCGINRVKSQKPSTYPQHKYKCILPRMVDCMRLTERQTGRRSRRDGVNQHNRLCCYDNEPRAICR